MAEVQSHGNDFEDLIITELTGKTKKEYDSLKGKDGYTSAMDIVCLLYTSPSPRD